MFSPSGYELKINECTRVYVTKHWPEQQAPGWHATVGQDPTGDGATPSAAKTDLVAKLRALADAIDAAAFDVGTP